MSEQLLFSVWAAAALKGTAVLGAAWLITALLRHRTAALRHMVWTAAFTIIILLPAGMATLPPAAVPAGSPLRILDPADAIPALQASAPEPAPLISTPQQRVRPPFNWRAAALLVWAAGALVGLARIVAALWALNRLRRNARLLPLDGLSDFCEIARVPRPVRVMEASSLMMPMSWGFRHPAVFLPIDARQWDSGRLRSVLLHELFHIRRRDVERQMAANLACALYWYNPLAWIGRRQFLAERERATDDLVLSAGVRPAGYAEDLLYIATTMRAADDSGCLTVGMARRSQIESRVRAILDPHARRTVARAAAVLVLVAGAAALALVSVRTHRPLPSEWKGWNWVHEIRVAKWAVEVEGRPPHYLLAGPAFGCGNAYLLKEVPKTYALACNDNGATHLVISAVKEGERPAREVLANRIISPGETVTFADAERWGVAPIRARLVPNRLPNQLHYRLVSFAPSVGVEGIEEYRDQYVVKLRNSSRRAATFVSIGISKDGRDEYRFSGLWGSPPGVAIPPGSTAEFAIGKRSLRLRPEGVSTGPMVTIHGACFSGGKFEGLRWDYMGAPEVEYEARRQQGKMVVAELRRLLGRRGVVTKAAIASAVSRTPDITPTAVAARLAHPELVGNGGLAADSARIAREEVKGALGFCTMWRNPDDGRRCVADLEKEYDRY
jgi:beta-lactamase regulating signal transducer with metallopeptidase domain